MDIADSRSRKKAKATKRHSVFDADAKFNKSPTKRRKGTSDGKKRPIEPEAEKNRDAPITKLPDDLLIKIMKMLPIAQWASLERVNHRFQAVVHGLWARTREIRLDDLKYKKENLKNDRTTVLNLVLRKLFLRAPNLTSISEFYDFCGEYKSIQYASVLALAKFEHLQTVNFSGGQISAENFAIFLETSASRQCFRYLSVAEHIEFCQPKSWRLAHALDNLPDLHLEDFVLDPRHLHSFDSLDHRFDWSALKKFVTPGDGVPGLPVLCKIIGRCIQLEHLEVRIPPCWNHQPSHVQVLKIVEKLENLSILKMKADIFIPCPMFEAGVVALIQALGRRRRITGFALDYNYCYDQIISEICGHLPDLKSLELNVANCTKSSVKLLLTGLKKLENLELRSLYVAQTDGGVFDVMAASLGNLKRLFLEYKYCTSWDSNDLAHLRKVEGLKELFINGIKIHDTIVEAWSRRGFGSCLESLEISFRSDVSSTSMADWFRNLSRLRTLRSIGLTDYALKVIADSCPRLVTLEVRQSPNITRVGIQSVIDCCSQLKVLKVIGREHDAWFPKKLNVGKYRKIVFRGGYEV